MEKILWYVRLLKLAPDFSMINFTNFIAKMDRRLCAPVECFGIKMVNVIVKTVRLLNWQMVIKRIGSTVYGMIHIVGGCGMTCKVFKDGSRVWYQNKQFHRLDGPALIYKNGNKYWYQNGDLHREDGPAVEWADGYKEWWIHGFVHKKEFKP